MPVRVVAREGQQSGKLTTNCVKLTLRRGEGGWRGAEGNGTQVRCFFCLERGSSGAQRRKKLLCPIPAVLGQGGPVDGCRSKRAPRVASPMV